MHASDDLEHLDDEQRAAVTATAHAIAVLAGPGSGKTRTLSFRARHLLTRDAKARALLLTFTNKAAAEMKTRALGVSEVAAERIAASTFHTFGASILRSHGDLVSIGAGFDIVDEEEAAELGAEVAAVTGLPNASRSWSYRRCRQTEPPPSVAAFGDAYERAKREAGVVDFDDLVVYPAQLLSENEKLAVAYARRFEHILVDEFQDTNPAQFAILKALAPHAASVSMFADDDQAIFHFAGAEVRNIRRFVDELEAKVYPLTCNYRCREEIVRRANLLIEAEPSSSGRTMRAYKSGGDVELRTFTSTDHEAVEIAAEIADAVQNAGEPPARIAVLVRNGWRANDVTRQLERHSVPVNDWRGSAYQPAGRRILSVCMAAMRGRLTDRQARLLSELMEVELIDERDTHQFLAAQNGHPVADALLKMRALAFDGAPPHAVVRQAQAAVAAAAAELAVELDLIVDAVVGFEAFDSQYTLEHLLADLALKSQGRPPTAGGGVKIATLHSAKGLEWPIVYLVGLEEGKLPDFHASTPDEMSEERRACFVGVCRAEDRLVLTYSRRYGVHRQARSRFLNEMEL